MIREITDDDMQYYFHKRKIDDEMMNKIQKNIDESNDPNRFPSRKI